MFLSEEVERGMTCQNFSHLNAAAGVLMYALTHIFQSTIEHIGVSRGLQCQFQKKNFFISPSYTTASFYYFHKVIYNIFHVHTLALMSKGVSPPTTTPVSFPPTHEYEHMNIFGLFSFLALFSIYYYCTMRIFYNLQSFIFKKGRTATYGMKLNQLLGGEGKSLEYHKIFMIFFIISHYHFETREGNIFDFYKIFFTN